MRHGNLRTFYGWALLASLLGTGGAVDAEVLVTEIWQNGSTETTPDWFELTNFGDTAVDPSTLYYDDSSADPTEDGQLLGITNLEPGESAVYLVSWHDDFPGADFPPPFDPSDALAAFDAFWGVNGAYQVGYVSDPDTAGGPGLGGGGDAVNIYDGNTEDATLLDSKSYPDSSNEFPADNQGVTWVYNTQTKSDDLQFAALGAFGAFASVDGTQVGSPGVVPEPATWALASLGVLAWALSRARKS